MLVVQGNNQHHPPTRRSWLTSTALVAAVAIGLSGAGLAFGIAPAHADSAVSVSPHAGTIDGMVLDRNGAAIVNDLTRTEIAPGLVQYSYERIDATGRQPISILKAQLGEDTVRLKYLTPDTVSGTGATVSEMTDKAGAVAGVNLEYFDINNSWAAGGWGVTDGSIVKSGNPGTDTVFAQTTDGLAKLVNLTLKGTASFTGGDSVAISRVNTSGAVNGEVTLFTSQWGAYHRDLVLNGVAGVEVVVNADGTVASVGAPGAGQLADGQEALVATGNSAAGASLAKATVGQKVAISYDFDRSMTDVTEAGGIWQNLIRDGKVQSYGSDTYYTGRNPRTILGISQDGKTVYFVVADGRATNALGMTFDDEIALMQDLGAYDAVNVDGGGSSQMNSRKPGDKTSSVDNTPSDGVERYDGDGIGLVLAKPGSGTPDGVSVAPVSTDADANRVFPGLHRTLSAKPYDDSKSAVDAAVSWKADDEHVQVGTGDSANRVKGVSSGSSSVTATSGSASGTAAVQVLGSLERVTASSSSISLTSNAPTDLLTLTGHDANGFSAPLEVQDTTVSGNKDDLVELTTQADGQLKLKAVGDSGSETLSFRVNGIETQVAVTVGVDDKEIVNIGDVFDKDGWYASGSRATMSLAKAIGHDGTTVSGEKLTYDFTQSSATRTANTWPKGSGYSIPGQPKTIKVWAKGVTSSGDNPKTYIAYSDANGTFHYIYGDAPTTEWSQLKYSIPDGTVYPIKFEGVAAYETASGNQTKGDMWFDNPVAEVAPDVDLPETAQLQDHEVIRETGSTDSKPQRIAILSDAQFVGRNPDSFQANGARQALAEIVASKPDALFIDGDLVDEASTADFALAKQILDEGLKDATFPWYYVPGNHEIMGASIDNFKNAALGGFGGATNGHVDIAGTRFITLDTSKGKLSSDFSQLQMLRAQLDDARTNSSVTGVVIVQHMPIDDQNVVKVSQLSDRLDAAMEREWMEEFRTASGKSIAMVNGHVGDFYAKRDDGIPYVVNGNSGKNPADGLQGGFVGWTTLGIDPSQGDWKADGKDLVDDNAGWFTAETHVRATKAQLDSVKDPITAGASITLTGTVTQDDDRTATLAWPMSVSFTGSTGVYVGQVSDAPADTVAVIDPAAMTLTGLRQGSGTVTVDVSGQTSTVGFRVTGGDASISGTARVGKTVSASAGSWAAGADQAVQWTRDGQPIQGATHAEYLLTAEDFGHAIAAEVTVSRAGATAIVALAQVASIGEGTQTVAAPEISGAAQVGQLLTAQAGTENGTLSYQWLRNDAAIAGANGSTYLLQQEDQGQRISVQVTVTRNGYAPASVTSTQTAAVVAATAPTPKAKAVKATLVVSVKASKGKAVALSVRTSPKAAPAFTGTVTVRVAQTKKTYTVRVVKGSATVRLGGSAKHVAKARITVKTKAWHKTSANTVYTAAATTVTKTVRLR